MLVPKFMLQFFRITALLGMLLVADWAIAEPFEARLGAWARENLVEEFNKGSFSAGGISVFSDTQELLTLTVGYQHEESSLAADPHRTRFRISSITKVFSAVAIAMLVQDGLIESLKDPVNRYLRDFRVPDNRGEPIALHHLLTHTAGFDYSVKGVYSAGNTSWTHTDPSVEELIPPFARPAGRWAVYSNYGGALLGYVVEQITGKSLERFLAERIFFPLGMNSTQLFRAGRSVNLASSYGITAPMVFSPTTVRDFGRTMSLSMGIESSMHDMGRFARFLLTGKTHSGAVLLETPAHASLFKLRFRNHEHSSGFGMILDIVRQTDDLTLYTHNGDARGYSSQLLLVPARDLGVFIALAGHQNVSSSLGDAAVPISAPRLTASFVRDLLVPYQPPAGDGEFINPGELRGTYVSDKRALKSPEALFGLLHHPMIREVRTVGGQYLSNDRAGEQIAPGVFHFGGPFAYREMFSWENGDPVMSIFGSVILRRQALWLDSDMQAWLLLAGLALFAVLPFTLGLHSMQFTLIVTATFSAVSAVLILLLAAGPWWNLARIYNAYLAGYLVPFLALLALIHGLVVFGALWLVALWRSNSVSRWQFIVAAFLYGVTLTAAIAFDVIGEGTRWLM